MSEWIDAWIGSFVDGEFVEEHTPQHPMYAMAREVLAMGFWEDVAAFGLKKWRPETWTFADLDAIDQLVVE